MGFSVRIAIGAACAALGAIAGFGAALVSWDGTVAVHFRGSPGARAPAAIRRIFDFSHLDGGALRLASQRRLVTDARVILADAEIGLELGHFVTKSEDGTRLFACEYFDRIDLSFEAEGIAASGEKPTMKIEAPCEMSEDLNRIAPIWIPFARLAEEDPVDMDISYSDTSATRLRFENMPGAWPRTWVLAEIRIYSARFEGREIAISREEMRQIVDRLLRISW